MRVRNDGHSGCLDFGYMLAVIEMWFDEMRHPEADHRMGSEHMRPSKANQSNVSGIDLGRRIIMRSQPQSIALEVVVLTKDTT